MTTATYAGRQCRIVVEFDPPPIPDRAFDYCAWMPDEAEPGVPQGYGPTKQDALDDLLEQLESIEAERQA